MLRLLVPKIRQDECAAGFECEVGREGRRSEQAAASNQASGELARAALDKSGSKMHKKEIVEAMSVMEALPMIEIQDSCCTAQVELNP